MRPRKRLHLGNIFLIQALWSSFVDESRDATVCMNYPIIFDRSLFSRDYQPGMTFRTLHLCHVDVFSGSPDRSIINPLLLRKRCAVYLMVDI